MKPSLALLLLLGACSSLAPADPCSGAAASCESSTQLRFCDNGTLRRITCKGPAGCSGSSCDTSTHSAGDGCQGALSRCDPINGAQVLQCVLGVLKVFRTCGGPRGCYVEAGLTGCDVTLGDSCPAAYNARYFCDSVDTQQVLVCSDGGIGFFSTCAGVKRCLSGDGGLTCQ